MLSRSIWFLAVVALPLATLACGGADCPAPQPCPACQPAAPPPASPTATVEEWIQLPVRILFTTAGDELSAENRALLDQAVQTLRARNDIQRVRIEGHTDTRGRDAENSELSLQRAQAVMNYLVSRGVPQGMLEVVGYGAERPLVVEAGHEENRTQNRRVEFSALVSRPASQQGQPL